jgi:hypothetical protein
MDHTDNLRERVEALADHAGRVEQWSRWWRGIAQAGVLVGILSVAVLSQAADFACASGDVACLIDAINTANANGDANTITLDVGTYTLTAVDNISEGSPAERNGLPSITSTLTLRGADPATTIIERAVSAPGFRILHIAAGGTLTVEGLTIQGGQCAELSVPHCLGGGGLRNLGTLTLQHSVVQGNRSGTEPGGGGGGGLQNLGTATLTDCTFVNNFANNINGGGIENWGTLTIQRCTFSGNSLTEGGGGAIYNGTTGVLLLTDSTLTDNRGELGSIRNSGALVVTNSTLTKGQSNDGGGLYNGGGTAIFLNSTLAENTGGGIANAGGTVVLLNTLLARNTPGRAGTLDCAGPITTLGHNLIGDPTGCTLTLQASDITADPGLATFRDNGRPGNGHFNLLSTSQAIDAGDDGVCPRTDQLGRRRRGPCDIGAIRFPEKREDPQ